MIVQGMGVCLIPNDKDRPCGKQLQDGEPIGTIVLGGPIIGHKACADRYELRKREKKETAMKIGRQQGPGGSIGDPAQYQDALAHGSVPLEKPDAPDLTGLTSTSGSGDLGAAVAPVGGSAEPPVSPEVLATLTQERHTETVDAEEADALRRVREEYAAKRRAIADAPVAHTINIDLSHVPTEADVLEIRLDLRTLRP